MVTTCSVNYAHSSANPRVSLLSSVVRLTDFFLRLKGDQCPGDPDNVDPARQARHRTHWRYLAPCHSVPRFPSPLRASRSAVPRKLSDMMGPDCGDSPSSKLSSASVCQTFQTRGGRSGRRTTKLYTDLRTQARRRVAFWVPPAARTSRNRHHAFSASGISHFPPRSSLTTPSNALPPTVSPALPSAFDTDIAQHARSRPADLALTSAELPRVYPTPQRHPQA